MAGHVAASPSRARALGRGRPRVGIPILQRGLFVAARRPDALAVLQRFAEGPMGEGCRILSGDDIPPPFRRDLAVALHSPHELRIEPREAIPRLAARLEAECGVRFLWRTHVRAIDPPRLDTAAGTIRADRIVVCPGNDFLSLYPETIADYAPVRCKLSMLRLASPGWRLPGAVMSDLGLVRHAGYADLPGLDALGPGAGRPARGAAGAASRPCRSLAACGGRALGDRVGRRTAGPAADDRRGAGAR